MTPLHHHSAVHYVTTGDLSFDAMTLAEPGAVLIFIAFGVKCAFPLLHNWLQDAYPEATVTGTVVLSIYTTKLAVYTLARGFPGTEQLVWIGVAMTLFPVVYAVIENDLRRVLSYSLNNQLGFMVVGIGIGTELAINGAVAHAFAHIIYKALLFMAMGAVLYRVGTIKASELGDHRGAIELRLRALALTEAALGRDNVHSPPTLDNLGFDYLELGRHDEAREAFERSRTIKLRDLDPEHIAHAASEHGLGEVALHHRQLDAAIEHFERAAALTSSGKFPTEFAETRFGLARALWASQRDLGRAVELARQAAEALGDPTLGDEDLRAEIEAWLAEHAGGRSRE